MTSAAALTTISERMKNYRIDYPLTQRQLAERSGVSLRSIQRFEKGEDIQFSNLVKLLRAMQLHQNIALLIPDVTTRPPAFVNNASLRRRARVSKKETNDATRQFVWGDEQ